MTRPADLPFTEHFQQLPCRVRAKYIGAGCRCMLCRAANSRYETMRAAARKRGEWNGLVSADAVRAHLFALSDAGVGYKSVAAAAGVGHTTLMKIRAGRKLHLRRQTERRILDVDQSCIADGALVDARPAMRLIRSLLREGYPALRLCRFLGYKGQGLQFNDRRMTARNALRVERLYRELMAVDGDISLAGRPPA
jgi:hypothetical protein